MNKRLLSIAVVLLSGGSTLSAEDSQVRLGISSISGTVHTVNASGYTSPYYNIDGSGFEVSLVSGVDKREGFYLRPVLTIQSNDTSIEGISSSDIMLLGEFEFAYNINEDVSPFIGFYGGIGMTDIPVLNESGRLTYDLGLLIGVNGTLNQDFGYYAKYTAGIKGYNIQNNTLGVRQSLSSMKLGVSYTFSK